MRRSAGDRIRGQQHRDGNDEDDTALHCPGSTGQPSARSRYHRERLSHCHAGAVAMSAVMRAQVQVGDRPRRDAAQNQDRCDRPQRLHRGRVFLGPIQPGAR